MNKQITAKEAREQAEQARKKLAIKQHGDLYAAIKKAVNNGKNSMWFYLDEIDLIYKSVVVELEKLGFRVEIKIGANPYSMVTTTSARQEVHISW